MAIPEHVSFNGIGSSFFPRPDQLRSHLQQPQTNKLNKLTPSPLKHQEIQGNKKSSYLSIPVDRYEGNGWKQRL